MRIVDDVPEHEADESPMLPPDQVARNIVLVLRADPRNYRNFGVYWWWVKPFLLRYHTRDELYMLGDYRDKAVAEIIPQHESETACLRAALETYGYNARYNMLRPQVGTPDGEEIWMYDDDAGL